MKTKCCLTTLLATLLLAVPPLAAAPGSLGDSHGIYIGESRILDAEPARQLTLREDVRDFWFSPSGDKIAYVTYIEDHGERRFAIKLVDTWRHDPEIKTLVTQAAPADLENAREEPLLQIVGWAGEDQYLIYTRTARDSANDGPVVPVSSTVGFERLDLSAASPEARPLSIAVKSNSESFGGLNYAWSPGHDRLLLSQYVFASDPVPPNGEKHWVEKQTYFICDPVTALLHPLSLDPSDTVVAVMGWLDGGHLLVYTPGKDKKRRYQNYDLASGAFIDTTRPEDWGKFPDRMLSGQHDARDFGNPKDKSLSLTCVSHHLPASGGSDHVPATTIWVTHSPAMKTLTVLPVGMTPGSEAPQAQWSPSGKAVAFVAHGDLFLTNLAKRPASAREKLAAGEPVSCEEMNQVASANLREIGLAMIQFIQDNDERFPPSAGFQNLVAPYLKDTNVFTVGAGKFVYYGNEKMGLADIDSPSDDVIGQIETSCGHNILFVDGHVKTFDEQSWTAWKKLHPQQKT